MNLEEEFEWSLQIRFSPVPNNEADRFACSDENAHTCLKGWAKSQSSVLMQDQMHLWYCYRDKSATPTFKVVASRCAWMSGVHFSWRTCAEGVYIRDLALLRECSLSTQSQSIESRSSIQRNQKFNCSTCQVPLNLLDFKVTMYGNLVRGVP